LNTSVLTLIGEGPREQCEKKKPIETQAMPYLPPNQFTLRNKPAKFMWVSNDPNLRITRIPSSFFLRFRTSIAHSHSLHSSSRESSSNSAGNFFKRFLPTINQFRLVFIAGGGESPQSFNRHPVSEGGASTSSTTPTGGSRSEKLDIGDIFESLTTREVDWGETNHS
jgi:hypothetical protein